MADKNIYKVLQSLQRFSFLLEFAFYVLVILRLLSLFMFLLEILIVLPLGFVDEGSWIFNVF